ncbi:MAG TPA: YfcE family phosphodiesterase [Tepidisphaeraceae bacterium]|jgi:putative phosphoesterase
MVIGILSDSHDRPEAMAAAVKTLTANGAEFLIHCGDVGGEAILDYLAGGAGVPSAFVWGNNDFDRRGLQRYAEELGINCLGNLGELELGGKRFVVLHGDDERTKQRLIAEQRHDYLLQGHTHIPLDQRIGKMRCINPGALHRAREKTVALLNTETDELTFLILRNVAGR